MNLQAAVIEVLPPSSDREYWYPRTNNHGPWLLVLVEPERGDPWRAFFAANKQGWRGKGWGLYSWPDEDWALAVAAGSIYRFAPGDPHSAAVLDLGRVHQVVPVPGQHRVLAVDDIRAYSIAPDGVGWTSERIGWDDVNVEEITETHAKGRTWNPMRAEFDPFTLRLDTGELVHGGGLGLLEPSRRRENTV